MFMPVNDQIQPAKIKVLGIGGAGGNAVNRMINYKFTGVDFISINTDLQILSLSKAPTKIQIGRSIAKGLGGGGDPEIGKKAAEENKDDIKKVLEGSDLVFITAGMGGATGTGASPVVAEIAKELGILTIAIVTRPFLFEGKKRNEAADIGIRKLKEIVDTMIVVPNEKLKMICDRSTPLNMLFESADNVLYQATKGISDIITRAGYINRDFADVKSIMSHRGDAIIGVGSAKGDDKGASAAQIALDCPILEDASIDKASAILLSITGPERLAWGDVEDAIEIIKKRTNNNDINLTWGVIYDNNIEDEVRITIVATGINGNVDKKPEKAEALELFPENRDVKENFEDKFTVKRNYSKEEDIEKPAFLRRASD